MMEEIKKTLKELEEGRKKTNNLLESNESVLKELHKSNDKKIKKLTLIWAVVISVFKAIIVKLIAIFT